MLTDAPPRAPRRAQSAHSGATHLSAAATHNGQRLPAWPGAAHPAPQPPPPQALQSVGAGTEQAAPSQPPAPGSAEGVSPSLPLPLSLPPSLPPSLTRHSKPLTSQPTPSTLNPAPLTPDLQPQPPHPKQEGERGAGVPETLEAVAQVQPTSPQDPSRPIDLQIWYFYPLVQIGRIDGQTLFFSVCQR